MTSQASSMNIHASLNPTDLFSSKGLVVVITGGGSGIGLTIAASLHQTGASKVYLLGRRENTLKDAISTLTNSPHAPQSNIFVPVVCDVTSTDSISKAVDQITQESGYIDVLINNAGVIGPRNGGAFHEANSIEAARDAMLQGIDDWDVTMATNTKSVVSVSASFLPLLEAGNKRKGWAGGKVSGSGVARQRDTSSLQSNGVDADDDRFSHIITIASVASYMRVVKAGWAYNASKAAAAHLGKMLATMLAEWGIRSNVICPGPFPSEMTVGNSKVVYGTDEIPTGRMGNEKDVAGLILFLVGKGGAYINGTVQLTDGGRLGVFPSVY